MSLPETKPVTAAALLEMPDGGLRYEFIRGALKVTSPSNGEHGGIAYKLAVLVGVHIETNELRVELGAETGFKLSSDPDTVRAADFTFVASPERRRVLSVRDTLESGDALSGWQVAVADIFAR